jgi:hypothetical protein
MGKRTRKGEPPATVQGSFVGTLAKQATPLPQNDKSGVGLRAREQERTQEQPQKRRTGVSASHGELFCWRRGWRQHAFVDEKTSDPAFFEGDADHGWLGTGMLGCQQGG